MALKRKPNFLRCRAAVPRHARAINKSGAIAGWYQTSDNIEHGFVHKPGGSIMRFDDPDTVKITEAKSINKADAITGIFTDAGGTYHGFLRTP